MEFIYSLVLVCQCYYLFKGHVTVLADKVGAHRRKVMGFHGQAPPPAVETNVPKRVLQQQEPFGTARFVLCVSKHAEHCVHPRHDPVHGEPCVGLEQRGGQQRLERHVHTARVHRMTVALFEQDPLQCCGDVQRLFGHVRFDTFA